MLIVTHEEEHALNVCRNTAIETGQDVYLWTASLGLRDGLVAGSTPIPDTEHPAAALYKVAHTDPPKAIHVFCDLATHVKNDAKTLRLLREAMDRMADLRQTLILIEHGDTMPEVVASLAARFELSYPNEQELEAIIRSTLRDANSRRKLTIDLNRSQLDAFVKNLRGLTRRQTRQAIMEAIADDARFDIDDLKHVIHVKKQNLSTAGLLEFVEAPTDMDQIGGLNNLKTWLNRRRKAYDTDAADFGIDPPRGLLLLGVQGAGKSLASKAVATAWQRPLVRMDVGRLYDRYIGESERKLREALQQTEMMAPVILWIDEIEKAFASASGNSNDGGLSRRMFGTMLTWMQEHTAAVFMIATANDIEALPPELLRKGRFDEIFFVDLPTDEARQRIFEIHLSRRNRKPNAFDMPRLVRASDGYSGAEIEQAVLSALHTAFAADARDMTTEDLERALAESPPLSVTMAERIGDLRAWAKGRCVPAD